MDRPLIALLRLLALSSLSRASPLPVSLRSVIGSLAWSFEFPGRRRAEAGEGWVGTRVQTLTRGVASGPHGDPNGRRADKIRKYNNISIT